MDTTTPDPRSDRLGVRIARATAHQAIGGSWTREAHLDAPVPTLLEPMLAATARGFATGFGTWGFPIAGIDLLIVDGWLYTSTHELDELDEVLRRLERVERQADFVDIRAAAVDWIDRHLPELDERRRMLVGVDEGQLSADDLLARFVGLYDVLIDAAERRFTDMPGVNLLVAAFVVDAAETGVAPHVATALLAGASPATAGLADVVAAGGQVGFDGDMDDATSDDVCAPTLGELVERRKTVTTARPRRRSADADRLGAALGPALRSELDDARLAQDARESSRLLLHRTIGGVRRFALEIGRRLTAEGAIDAADDALVLGPDELVAAFERTRHGEHVRLQPLAAARRSELEAAGSIAPPSVHGQAPPPMAAPPDLGPGATRVFTLASAWFAMIDGERPAGMGRRDSLVGTAASAGRFTGRARVVHGGDDLFDVEPDDVLVCAMTSPPWCLAISICGALVSDVGGVCSHPAITAREFAIPAVVGTGSATSSISTGDLITVDGDTGLVTIHR